MDAVFVKLFNMSVAAGWMYVAGVVWLIAAAVLACVVRFIYMSCRIPRCSGVLPPVSCIPTKFRWVALKRLKE